MKYCPECGFRTSQPEKLCPLCGVRMRQGKESVASPIGTHVHDRREACLLQKEPEKGTSALATAQKKVRPEQMEYAPGRKGGKKQPPKSEKQSGFSVVFAMVVFYIFFRGCTGL